LGALESARDCYDEATTTKDELENMLESIQGHFRHLFYNLIKLRPTGVLDSEFNVVETEFGNIRLTDDGQVLIDPGVWENMCTELKRLHGMRGEYDQYKLLIALLTNNNIIYIIHIHVQCIPG